MKDIGEIGNRILNMMVRKYFTEKTIYTSIEANRNRAMCIYGRKKMFCRGKNVKVLEAECEKKRKVAIMTRMEQPAKMITEV